MKRKLQLTVDEDLIKIFKANYPGSISSFLEGCMVFYLKLKGIYTNLCKTGVPKTGENFTPPKIRRETTAKTAEALSSSKSGGESW